MRMKFLAGALLSVGALVAAPAVTAEAAPALTVRSGMEIDVEETIVTASECTLGAVLSPRKALTAGHCGEVGRGVYDARGNRIGTITANRIAKGLDIAVITLVPRARVQIDRINWSGQFFRGQPVSKNGVTTGFGRGVVTDPKPTKRTARGFVYAPPFLLQHSTISIRTSLLSKAGDSGSGVRDASGRIVGIVSSGASDRATAVAPVSYLPGYLR
ncbi:MULTISPECIES: S1 family peptidase [unclassified Gordonia (in: high G+C Gram-positive bacteria)]|uniref:S1 family peptidase n=1 Tax=unclassified Gordonia (in: high G+C Gram-positive bacteria) TaxID=2657482 RepID=UPI001F0D8B1B|nr:S1 family peptidase [Gordonia sp. ABSL49_1]MCH5641791.1 S1 family peptidase [Gordonia sp. ABSL49_1]